MAQPRPQGRSDKDARQHAPLGELHALEHLRAPWFFEAEFQRRLRTGDPGQQTRRTRGMWIGLIVFALIAGLAGTYVQFEETILDFFGTSGQPAPTAPETPQVPGADTTHATRPGMEPAVARPAPRTEPRSQRDTLRVAAPRRNRVDTASTVLPPPSTPVPAHESLRGDSAVNVERPRPDLPADTSHAPPDSVAGRRETP